MNPVSHASVSAPVIVCGLGRVGWPVIDYIRALGWPIIAIDQETEPTDPRLAGIHFIQGNFRDAAVLTQARLQDARGVILLANDDLNNLAACLEIRRLHPTVFIVVRLFNDNLVAKLSSTVSNMVALSSSRLSGPLLATAALSGDVLARFQTAGEDWQLERIRVDADSMLIGRSLTEVQQQHPSLHLLDHTGSYDALQAGNAQLWIGPVSDLPALRDVAAGEDSLPARWAGRMRRFLRTLFTTVREIEWPVKLAALCFFGVLLLGSVLYWLSGLSPTLSKGMFKTINIMVTSSNLEEKEALEDWHRVFISFLKIAGLLLTAAFTALLTNYLVRARLRGVLSISRIPESGHVVLCGLGTVGVRVVEALRQEQIPVVVMEKQEGGRFVAAARQRGATVMIADGTLVSTLERAHTGKARALVVATSSDLANVEIALLARELNPKLRVVMRLDDAGLARALRETVQIRLALALPQLVAPAFVLPLFGDRILTMFWWKNQVLYLVLELTITAETVGLLGQSPQQLEKEWNCWIIVPGQADKTMLNEGQTVLMVVSAELVSQVMEKCYNPRLLSDVS
ncbi:MAG: NAD-binding protein [Planctomycetia bacterium]|nr:NAD-binding protein [Planctomycetia bacterium]